MQWREGGDLRKPLEKWACGDSPQRSFCVPRRWLSEGRAVILFLTFLKYLNKICDKVDGMNEIMVKYS